MNKKDKGSLVRCPFQDIDLGVIVDIRDTDISGNGYEKEYRVMNLKTYETTWLFEKWLEEAQQ